MAGGLALVGAALGAAAGVCVFAALALAVEPRVLGVPIAYAVSAAAGAPLGAILAPVAALVFLRHVPLWRLFAEVTAGTVVCGAAAALAQVSLYAVVAAGAAGFGIATARLAIRTPRSRVAVRSIPAG